jgi:pimeloyl-ACP methyl ester carboxylesterase
MARAFLNGHSCHYEVHGSGPAVLFMHGGFGGSAPGGICAPTEEWLQAIAADFRLVIYDRRSAGLSSAPKSDHSLALFREDARALLDYLEVDNAAIWGQSAGGPIAACFALAFPDRTSSLVLTDATLWFSRDQEVLERLVGRLRVLETQGPEAAYEARRVDGAVGPHLFAPSQAGQPERERSKLETQKNELRQRLSDQTRSERIDLYASELRTLKAYIGFDITGSFRELRMPTLVISGTEDRIFPEVPWSEYAREMPNLTYSPMVGEPHGIGRSPNSIALIREFLLGR